jgi:hypothetical protein
MPCLSEFASYFFECGVEFFLVFGDCFEYGVLVFFDDDFFVQVHSLSSRLFVRNMMVKTLVMLVSMLMVWLIAIPPQMVSDRVTYCGVVVSVVLLITPVVLLR